MKLIAPKDIKAGQEIELGIISIDGQPVEPKVVGTWEKIWSFARGQVDREEFNDWAKWVRENKITDPQIFTDEGGQRYIVAVPHIAPLASGSGDLQFPLTSGSRDAHCDLKIVETKIGKSYRHEMRLRFGEGSRPWLDETDWCVVLQHWQKPGLNPPFALMVKKGQWSVQQYAAPNGPPADNDSWEIDENVNNLGEVGTDWHDIVVEYTPQPEHGRTIVVIDGKEVFDYYGPNCIAMPRDQGTIFFAGLYADHEKLEKNEWAQVEITKMDHFVLKNGDTAAIDPVDDKPKPKAKKLIYPENRGDVLSPDQPWEKRIAFGSVVNSPTGDFEMFYVPYTTEDKFSLARAWSADGINWEKPLTPANYMIDSQSTNIVNPECVSVNVEQSLGEYSAHVAEKFQGKFSYHKLKSRDGIDWSKDGDLTIPVDHDGDIICSVGWWAMHKHHIGGLRRWFVGEKETTGLGDLARGRQCYGISPTRMGNKFVALEWVFDIAVTTAGGSQIGPIWPRLTVSDDFVNWRPVFDEPIIPLAPDGEFGSGMIIPFSAPIIVGDEVWWYCTLSNYEHSLWWSDPVNNTARVYLFVWKRSDFEAMIA
jgi:hypothetical protein